MVFVSPGAYVRELDYSQYVPTLSTTIHAITGMAQRGPVGVPTLVTNEGDLERLFGSAVTFDYGLQAAVQFLKRGRQLLYNRVVSSTASKASIIVEDGTTADVFTVESLDEGSIYNGYQIDLANISFPNFDLIVSGVIDNEGTVGELERFVQLSLNIADDRYYIRVINEGVPGVDRASQEIFVISIDDSLTPTVGPFILVGGDDGATGLTAADIIGTTVGQKRTGLKALNNPEDLDMNLLAVPGVSDPAVIAEMFSLCEQRGDCFALVDPPIGQDPTSVIDYHNGASTWTHAAFNTSRAAMYWPWGRIYDPTNKQDIFLPPSAFAAAVYAYNDNVAEVWSAPAGLNRGRLNTATAIEMSPDLGQRDALYGNGNAVNPIINIAGHGIHIFGQRTLQRAPSALDRVNVRRMLLSAEKSIATAVKFLVFEPNDPRTWRRFVNLVKPALEFIKSRRGLFDFRVICDESTNTPTTIDRNEMRGRLLLKPTKTAEILITDFVLLSTGADFNEFAA